LILGALLLHGQGEAPKLIGDQSGQNQVWIMPGDSVISLDSLPIIEESLVFIKLNGDSLKPSFQWLKGIPKQIRLDQPAQDTMIVHYQRLPLLLYQSFFRKDSTLILAKPRNSKAFDQDLLYQRENSNFSPFSGLSSQGSISRSISVGNNQDAVLNSALNLQLAGRINENTELRASINDNTLPIQAAGTTQQLREFDRVYLELENPDFGLLRAGDYNMEAQDHYFLRFQKRISGAGVFSKIKTQGGYIPVEVQGGLARGRFARNRFQGQEGNQGPYKLVGNNNEQFIIIISGSERVYIDGILQKRGEQNDYVVNYNTGELSFTALQPITRDKRIVVEFQYTEQNYLRSVAQAQSGFVGEKWRMEFRYYSEQDSPNQPLTQDLSEDEQALLSRVGDNISAAQLSTISPAPYDPGLVQYQLKDSLGFDSVLVFSQDSLENLYNASFAFVGRGQGDYRLSGSSANGRVFVWVAPQNGEKQGSYAPIRSLMAPNRLQVLSFNGEGELSENQKLNISLASSNNNVNLLSDRDKSNDAGLAGQLAYDLKVPLPHSQLKFKAIYEFNNPGFTTVERIRPVEFARDWNLPLNYLGAVQLASLQSQYLSDSFALRYNLQLLNTPIRTGTRHLISQNWRSEKQLLRLSGSLTLSKDSLQESRFFREQLDYRFFLSETWWLGTKSVGEWNLQALANTDSLIPSSYSFFEYQVFTGLGDTAKSFVELGYLQRLDDSIRFTELSRFTEVNTYFARGTWKTNFNSEWQAAVNYRNLKIKQPTEEALQRTLTTRFNYQQRLWKNAVVSNSFYESGAGTEPRRSFTYVEVPPGTGTYTHTDYNGNGQRELDEFEIAPTPDLANFVRVFSPNVEFVRTNIIKLGQNLNINAPQSWQQKSDWRSFASRFSSLSAFQLDRRSLLTGGVNRLNPFEEPEQDSSIVALNNNFRQSVFFNRSRTQFGLDYTYRNTDNRTLVNFGVEQRRVIENLVNVRFTLAQDFLVRLRGSQQEKRNASGNFSSRNFIIDGYLAQASVSYQGNQKLVLTASHQTQSLSSEGENNNLLVQQNSGIECTYNLAESIAFQLNANYIFNGFEGEPNSPAGFEMLQALQPGNNLTLNLNLQRTFLKNIVLSLNYAGRFSPRSFAIHTGNLQVKAFF
jgi:hypothetical protein